MAGWTKADFDRFYRSNVERWGRPHSRPPIVLNYHWSNIISFQAYRPWAGLTTLNRPQLLANILGLSSGDAVVIVGCGFNGTGLGLTDLGIRVIGTELSTYIQNEKGNSEEADIRAACIAAGVDPDNDLIRGPSGAINPLDLLLEGGRSNPQARGKGEILEEELRVRGSRNAVLNRFNQLWPGTTPSHIITEEVLNSISDAEAALVCDYASSAASEWGATVVHMLSPLMVGHTQAPELNWKTYADWRSWLDTNGFGSHLILPTVSAKNQGMTVPVGNEPGVVTQYGGLF